MIFRIQGYLYVSHFSPILSVILDKVPHLRLGSEGSGSELSIVLDNLGDKRLDILPLVLSQVEEFHNCFYFPSLIYSWESRTVSHSLGKYK